MPKAKQTPGTALSALLHKHDLNYNRLAKAVGLSSAMIRLIARDENPVSAPVAFRLAKFFKTTPEYWLDLQLGFDITRAGLDKKLTKELNDIVVVDKASFERKTKSPKAAASKGGKAPAKKDAARGAAKSASKSTAPKAAKKAAAAKDKKAAAPKSDSKKENAPVARRGRSPIAVKTAAPKAAVKPEPTVKPEPEVRPMTSPSQPAVPPESNINEPKI